MAENGSPFLSLCMILRNEEENLPRCLKSVRGVVDEIICVDTGSTDRTPEIARDLGARVLFYPWQGDFAAARNHGLDHANGEWILILDADEELVGEDRDLLRDELRSTKFQALTLNILTVGREDPDHYSTTVVSRMTRLVRNRSHLRYRYSIHEELWDLNTDRPAVHGASKVRVRHYGYLPETVVNKDKVRRNLSILQLELVRDPNNSRTLFYVGTEFLRQGELAKAVAAFERATVHMQNWSLAFGPALLFRLAEAYLRQGWYQRALETSEAGIATYPKFVELRFLRGQACLALGRYRDALKEFTSCLALAAVGHDYPFVITGLRGHVTWRMLGQTYENLGMHAEAVRCYQEALRDHPGYAEALGALTGLLLKHDPPGQVRMFISRYLDSSRPSLILAAWEEFLAAGAEDEALALLAGSTSLPRVAMARVITLLRLGRPDEAADALASTPWTPDTAPIAKLYRMLTGLEPGGRQDHKTSLDLPGDDTGPEGSLYRALEQLVSESPGGEDGLSSDQLLRLVGILADVRAVGLIRRVDSRMPGGDADRARLRVQVGKLLFHKRLYEEALHYLVEGTRAGALDAEALEMLGDMAQVQEMWEDARNLYMHALELQPERWPVAVRLAKVLVRCGDRPGARRVLQRAMTQYPDSDVLAEVYATV